MPKCPSRKVLNANFFFFFVNRYLLLVIFLTFFFFTYRVVEPKSGRYLEVHTDQPGVQFYTSNALINGQGKRGAKFGKHSAFCLETQNFPNAVNIVSYTKI